MTAKGVILFTAMVGALLLCSCAKNEDTSSLTESQQEQSDFPRCIVGEWKCRETPLDNSELYSGYLSLIIRSDGNYLMYDAEAGNPCLKGTIEMDDDDLDLIFVDDSGVDFAPPAGWENMSKRREIGYFADSYTLKLTYTDNDNSVTLVFDAVNAPNEVKN